MKKIVMQFLIVITILFIAICCCVYTNMDSSDYDYTEPVEKPIIFDISQPLNYTEMPEVTEIALEEYPCDLTPIINNIKKIDDTFDETLYRLTVHNYSYDKKEIDGEIEFIYYVDGKIGAKKYYANVRNNVLTSIYYIK